MFRLSNGAPKVIFQGDQLGTLLEGVYRGSSGKEIDVQCLELITYRALQIKLSSGHEIELHIAPFSLFSQRPHRQSQQPNMLAYGMLQKKSLKIHFLFKRKAHPPRRTLSLALSLESSCLIDFWKFTHRNLIKIGCKLVIDYVKQVELWTQFPSDFKIIGQAHEW